MELSKSSPRGTGGCLPLRAALVVSARYPFDFDYRKFGGEWICANRFYKIPSRVLRTDPETKHVRVATQADRARIRAAYTRFAGSYRGLVARDDTQWNSLLEDTRDHITYTYLYEREGRSKGISSIAEGAAKIPGCRSSSP